VEIHVIEEQLTDSDTYSGNNFYKFHYTIRKYVLKEYSEVTIKMLQKAQLLSFIKIGINPAEISTFNVVG
jgi:hypothetical protein